MKPIAETIARIAESWYQRLSDDDKAEIEDVLDAAEQFTLGLLPIFEFAKLGTIPSHAGGRGSPEYTRFLASLVTPKEDPRRAPLLQAINACLRYTGLEITTSGIWDRASLGAPSSLGPMRIHPAQDPWNEAA